MHVLSHHLTNREKNNKTNFFVTIIAALTVVMLSALFVTHVIAATSKTYYVDINSSSDSDLNPCDTQAQPCTSIDGAWDKCSPGDTIIIKAGTYGPQTITGDKASPGCDIIGDPGVTTGPLNTDGQYITLENVTVNAGNSHNSGGLGVGASNVTLKNVNLHGPYVSAYISGVTNIKWLGGELGQKGITGGKRIVGCTSTGDPEPVQIGSASNITFDHIDFHPQDADLTPVSCSSNGFHLEMIRLDGGTNNFTLKNSTFDSGDHSGTSSIFITTPQPGTDLPHDLTFVNNFFGDVDASAGSFNVHQNVTTCQNITVAYNTLLSGDGAWQCNAFSNLKFIGNLGPRAASPCTGTYIKNVWQDSVDYASGALGSYYVCGTDKVVIGQRYGTEALGLSTDGFHITASSPAINAAETAGYCTGGLGATDIDGIVRPQGSACDAGADEYGTGGGSTGPKVGDFNNDGSVDAQDVAALKAVFGQQNATYDLTSDANHMVDVYDLSVLLAHFGS